MKRLVKLIALMALLSGCEDPEIYLVINGQIWDIDPQFVRGSVVTGDFELDLRSGVVARVISGDLWGGNTSGEAWVEDNILVGNFEGQISLDGESDSERISGRFALPVTGVKYSW